MFGIKKKPKFKTGDTVVCIKITGETKDWLELGKIYTISHALENYTHIELNEIKNYYFNIHNFETLIEHRIYLLNKIKNNIKT